MFERRFKSFTLVGLVCALLTAICLMGELFPALDRSLWDWRVRIVAQQVAPDPRIKLIMIDQASIDHYAEEESITWPWPRSLYVPMLQYLTKARAKAAAIDLIFSEASSWGVSEDQALSSSLSDTLPTVIAVAASEGDLSFNQERLKLLNSRQQQIFQKNMLPNELMLESRMHKYPAATFPIPELLESAQSFGSVTGLPDADGIFRRYVPIVSLSGEPILGLAIATYHAAAGKIESQQIAPYLDADQALTLTFTATPPSYPQYSIRAVIDSFRLISQGKEPTIPLSEFQDSYVFVGSNAAGLLDYRPNPLVEKAPGVILHATALDNLLNNRFARNVSPLLNLAVALLFVLVTVALAILPSRLLLQISGVLLVLIGFAEAGILSTQYGYRIEMGATGVSLVLATVISFAYRYYLEGGQYRFIKRAFAQYLSPQVVNQIARQPELLKLGGERKELTILFSDIQGFTSISEILQPQELSGLLNKYLSAISDTILAKEGTLDKYIGDAVVAFWNAPLSIDGHAAKAVDAALSCQEKLGQMRVELAQEYGVMLRSRIGIHTGEVVVGNFGSELRFAYTVLGDSANLASRLEGVNKAFGTSIIISSQTKDQLSTDFVCRKVGLIKVVGRNEAVEIFEPFRSSLDKDKKDSLAQFEAGRVHFENGELQKSAAIFGKLPRDPVAKAYLTRLIKEFGKDTIPERAQEGWSAVWSLTEK